MSKEIKFTVIKALLASSSIITLLAATSGSAYAAAGVNPGQFFNGASAGKEEDNHEEYYTPNGSDDEGSEDESGSAQASAKKTPSRANLLDQIKNGFTLKKVEPKKINKGLDNDLTRAIDNANIPKSDTDEESDDSDAWNDNHYNTEISNKADHTHLKNKKDDTGDSSNLNNGSNTGGVVGTSSPERVSAGAKFQQRLAKAEKEKKEKKEIEQARLTKSPEEFKKWLEDRQDKPNGISKEEQDRIAIERENKAEQARRDSLRKQQAENSATLDNERQKNLVKVSNGSSSLDNSSNNTPHVTSETSMPNLAEIMNNRRSRLEPIYDEDDNTSLFFNIEEAKSYLGASFADKNIDNPPEDIQQNIKNADLSIEDVVYNMELLKLVQEIKDLQSNSIEITKKNIKDKKKQLERLESNPNRSASDNKNIFESRTIIAELENRLTEKNQDARQSIKENKRVNEDLNKSLNIATSEIFPSASPDTIKEIANKTSHEIKELVSEKIKAEKNATLEHTTKTSKKDKEAATDEDPNSHTILNAETAGAPEWPPRPVVASTRVVARALEPLPPLPARNVVIPAPVVADVPAPGSGGDNSESSSISGSKLVKLPNKRSHDPRVEAAIEKIKSSRSRSIKVSKIEKERVLSVANEALLTVVAPVPAPPPGDDDFGLAGLFGADVERAPAPIYPAVAAPVPAPAPAPAPAVAVAARAFAVVAPVVAPAVAVAVPPPPPGDDDFGLAGLFGAEVERAPAPIYPAVAAPAPAPAVAVPPPPPGDDDFGLAGLFGAEVERAPAPIYPAVAAPVPAPAPAPAVAVPPPPPGDDDFGLAGLFGAEVEEAPVPIYPAVAAPIPVPGDAPIIPPAPPPVNRDGVMVPGGIAPIEAINDEEAPDTLEQELAREIRRRAVRKEAATKAKSNSQSSIQQSKQDAKNLSDKAVSVNSEVTKSEYENMNKDRISNFIVVGKEIDSFANSEITARLINVTPVSTLASMEAGMAAGDEPGNVALGTWISGLYGVSKRHTKESESGYKVNFAGGSVGLDFGIKDNTILGFVYSHIDSSFKYKSLRTGDKVIAKSHIGSVYAATELNNIIWQGIFSTSFSQVKNTRLELLNKKIATAKFSSNSYTLDNNLGYKCNIGNNVSVIPNIGLRYGHYIDGAYKETGADKFNQIVSKRTNSDLTGILGTKLTFAKELNNGVKLTPTIHASVENTFNNKKRKVKTKLSWINDYFENKAAKFDSTSFNLGANVLAERKNLAFSIGYNIVLGKKTLNHQGSLKFKIKL